LRLQVRCISSIICLGCLLASCVTTFTDAIVLPAHIANSTENYYKSRTLKAKFQLFLSNNSTITQNELDGLDMKATNNLILYLFNLIVEFHGRLFSFYIDLGLISSVICLWTAVYRFRTIYVHYPKSTPKKKGIVSKLKSFFVRTGSTTSSSIEENTENQQNPNNSELKIRVDFQMLILQYKIIHDLARNVNRFYGRIAFLYTIEGTLFYVTSLKSFINEKKWTTDFMIAQALIISAVIFLFAANVYSQVRFDCYYFSYCNIYIIRVSLLYVILDGRF